MNSFHNNNNPTTSTSGSRTSEYSVCPSGGLVAHPRIPVPLNPPTHHHQPSRASQQNVKVKRKCMEVVCQPSVILLCCTVVMTVLATVMLSISLTARYWELMAYDPDQVSEIVAEGNRSRAVQWLFDGRLPLITYEKPGDNELVYLFPLQSGVWISCIDLEGTYALFIPCHTSVHTCKSKLHHRIVFFTCVLKLVY